MTDFEAELEVGIFCAGCAEREFDSTPWCRPDDT
jgi:hypothetical protein